MSVSKFFRLVWHNFVTTDCIGIFTKCSQVMNQKTRFGDKTLLNVHITDGRCVPATLIYVAYLQIFVLRSLWQQWWLNSLLMLQRDCCTFTLGTSRDQIWSWVWVDYTAGQQGTCRASVRRCHCEDLQQYVTFLLSASEPYLYAWLCHLPSPTRSTGTSMLLSV